MVPFLLLPQPTAKQCNHWRLFVCLWGCLLVCLSVCLQHNGESIFMDLDGLFLELIHGVIQILSDLSFSFLKLFDVAASYIRC